MKRTMKSATAFLLGAHFTLLLILSLSCCGPSDNNPDPGEAGMSNSTTEKGVWPESMTDALKSGKEKNRVVMIELFDPACEYCSMMLETFNDDRVVEALSDLVYARITVEDKGVIEEFEMFQSPTFLFFKPDGTFIDPYITGFRQAELFSVEIENYKRLAAGKEELPYPEDNHPDFGKG